MYSAFALVAQAFGLSTKPSPCHSSNNFGEPFAGLPLPLVGFDFPFHLVPVDELDVGGHDGPNFVRAPG